MKIKKVSVRTCIGCGATKPKQELARVVRTPEKGIEFDITGKVDGRGAYICTDVKCFKKMRISGSLPRSLEIVVEPDKMDQLEKVFKKTYKAE